MKILAMMGMSAALLAAREGQDKKEFQPPQAQKQHEWLKQLIGEWDADIQMYFHDKPEASQGRESGRMVGEFWAVMENKGEFRGKPFFGVFTIGYDTDQKKFVGTWYDSMSHHMWQYTGDVDSAGKILTLETEGPCPGEGGKIMKFRETIEIKTPDHKVLTSMKEKDGKWVKNVVINYKRRASE